MPPLWDLRDGDDDDDDEPRHRGDDDDDGGGGGSGGGSGGGDDDDDDSGGDGGGDSGGGDSGDGGGDGGGDSGGGDSGGGGGFDWGDSGGDSGGGDSGGGDSVWSAVQDYEENGRTIRKFTDNTGTDYFQDVGEWSPRGSSSDRGFDWGDGSTQQDNGSQRYTQPPDVHPDIQDLHDYYHPYTISKFENDPIRQGWGDGTASDGTRFDQQDPQTQDMFTSSYGDQAAASWAEQRSKDLQQQFQSTGVVTLPKPQEPDSASPLPLFGLPRPTNPDGSVVEYTNFQPDPQTYTNMPGPASIPTTPVPESETVIPPYVPPAAEAPTPQPAAEAPAPQPRTEAEPPPVTVHPAVQAAADAVARAGGSPDQVAQAAVQATLAADQSRSLSGESIDTQIRFRGLYGAGADATWRQQHNQELALNRALYGTEEPQAGARQTGTIPGLGDVGPAPDRTIGRAQPAPWNQPPSAAPAAPASARPPEASPPSAIYNGLTPSAGPAVASAYDAQIERLTRPPEALPVEPNPNTGVVRGPTTVPPPLTAAQAAAYERGGVNPSTGDIDVQATPPGPGGETASDILTIRNGAGEVRQEPRWAWDQRGPQGQQVWEVLNSEPSAPVSRGEAGFSPTSNQIDTSIRASAGLPVENPDLGPHEGGRPVGPADPFAFITETAARAQGATDLPGFQRNVMAGIASGEAWAEPYVADMARHAWYQQTRGLEGSPDLAPATYVRDWTAMFRAGQTDAPLQNDLANQMRERGVPTPADLAKTAEVKQVVADWRSNVVRLNQNVGASYSNAANAATMALYACGAASFATAVNAINPDAHLKVDDAMALLNRGGRNLINPSVGLTLGSDLSAMAPAFNEAGVDAEARNFTPQTIQQHFEAGGGPIVFSGPGWGRAMGVPSVPAHIYTATNADADGVTIVDSSGSNLTRMTWGQWQGATGGPARGAGISAVPTSAPSPGATVAASEPTGTTVRMQATDTAPSPQANLKPTFTGDEAVAMRQRIMAEMPDIQFAPDDDIETRMQKIAPALEWLQKEYGVSADAMAGMAYNENHLGMANSGAVRGNNLWSMTYVPQDPLSSGPIPEGRWAKYPSIKAGLARFVGMYAHPDNGYKGVWENRGERPAFLKALRDNKYFVVEPGAEHWNPDEGANLYQRIRAGTNTTKEDPSLGRGR